jgi:hypothetical protein
MVGGVGVSCAFRLGGPAFALNWAMGPLTQKAKLKAIIDILTLCFMMIILILNGFFLYGSLNKLKKSKIELID